MQESQPSLHHGNTISMENTNYSGGNIIHSNMTCRIYYIIIRIKLAIGHFRKTVAIAIGMHGARPRRGVKLLGASGTVVVE